jgi:FdhE protein
MSRAAVADPFGSSLHKRLETLTRQSPDLAPAATVQAAMLPLLRAAGAEQAAPDFDPEAARRSLAAGRPVLADQGLSFDLEAAAQLFRRLARAVENPPGRQAGRHSILAGHAGPPGSLVRNIRVAAERERLDLPALWQALASGDADLLWVHATQAGLDVPWLRLLGENSLKPALRALQSAVSPLVALAEWQRGPCPVCGSPPLIAEIQGKEGGRNLRCGLCAAAWQYPRLKCAYCATTNHLQLGFLSVEGEDEKYRVQTCDACHGYVKAVVTFDPIPEDMLAVEDLATLHLDQLAVERGFSRAPLMA